MYRIKTNGNVNLAINDIKVALSASNVDGMLVSKEKIDNSKDAQRLIASKLLIVEEALSASVEKKQTPKVKNSSATVFVTEGSSNTNPSDVFVRQPERKVEVAQVQEVASKLPEEVFVDAPAIVAEVNVEPKLEVSEEKLDEVAQEVVEEAITEDKPKARVKQQNNTKKN